MEDDAQDEGPIDVSVALSPEAQRGGASSSGVGGGVTLLAEATPQGPVSPRNPGAGSLDIAAILLQLPIGQQLINNCLMALE